ncbi:hypothetical protein QCE47_26295 [Caballeronia sp. LZ025]|uniref:hypothetical protein n=1 Tax=Caballeronia TaxID=1827195 RepID=UPI001FCFC78B|nr:MULTISPECIES: hypothetical protein [Caballeronia]MDR5735835.1 hypothetical protein [Caballeronia sp. LZ025]
MAYDLRRIGPEKPVPPFEPAWIRWAVFCVILAGGIAVGVVSRWPKGESAHAAWFWTCATVLPILLGSAPFLFYLGVLQARRSNAQEYNDDRGDYIRQVQREGGVPLHLLASGFVFSAYEHENTPVSVTEKKLLLQPRSRYPGDGQCVTARWIESPNHCWLPGGDGVDIARHEEIFRLVADSLVKQISSAIKALPEHLPVLTELGVDTLLPTSSVESIWAEVWKANQLKAVSLPLVRTDTPALIEVDKWLDGGIPYTLDAVRIMGSVRLATLLSASPVAGTTEAGAVLVFATDTLSKRKRLDSKALLYRPERGDQSDLAQSVRQILFWSRAKEVELEDLWFGGGSDAPLFRTLMEQLDAQGIALAKARELKGHHDIDLRIGSAGFVAPWLAIALASVHANISAHKQLVSVADDEALTLAIVVPRT